MGGPIDIGQGGWQQVIYDHDHLVTKVRCMDLPDSDRGDFSCRHAIDSSSFLISLYIYRNIEYWTDTVMKKKWPLNINILCFEHIKIMSTNDIFFVSKYHRLLRFKWYIFHIKIPQILEIHSQIRPGPWFNIKMSSYQYRKSHCGDKMILRPSYLHNRIFYTGKMISLYWIGAQNILISLNIMAGDDLVMPGARESAGMVITQFTWNNPVHFSQCIKVWKLAGTNLIFDNFQAWKRRKTCWSDRKTRWPSSFFAGRGPRAGT